MSTFKDRTIADSYDTIVKRAETYVQTGTNIELMTDTNATIVATGLYLEGGGGMNVGIGESTPDALLHLKSATPWIDIEDSGASNQRGKIGMSDNNMYIAVTSSSGNIYFRDNMSTTVDPGGAGTTNMAIISTGNIGIGTETPAAQLDIENTTANSATQGGILRLGANDGTVMVNTDRLGVIEFAGNENGSAGGSATMTVGARIEALAMETWDATSNGATLGFWTASGDDNASVKMTINELGKVGIGTIDPKSPLTIFGGDGYGEGIYFNRTSNNGFGISNDVADASDGLRFSYTSDDFSSNNTAIMMLKQSGRVGIGVDAPSANLDIQNTDLVSTPLLQLNCTEANLDSGGIFMKIVASGDANIHDNSAAARLITFYDGGGEMGYITTASDGVVNAFSSDVRLKKDIKDSDIEGLSIINAVKIRDFTWNEKVGKAREGRKVKTGYVADELYEVYPSATIGTPGAMKDIKDDNGNKIGEEIDAMSVVESQFISVLIKAVQELSAKVTALEGEDSSSDTKIAALEAKDTASEAKIVALEAEDTANKAKVATLETEDVANKAKITALEAKDAEYATTIAALTARITALESA